MRNTSHNLWKLATLISENVIDNEPPSAALYHDDEKRASALFQMKLATVCKLSESALDVLVSDFSLSE